MICRICGEEFRPNRRGKQTDVCNKEECKKARHREYQKKYLENKKIKEGLITYTTTVSENGLAINDSVSAINRDVVCIKDTFDSFGDIIEKIKAIRDVKI